VPPIDAADAFVVVTPEYNHSYPASLKHAIDMAHGEWNTKPVAFVSYGGISGGLRAVEALRLVFAELHATTIRDTVSFHGGAGSPARPDGPARQTRLAGSSGPELRRSRITAKVGSGSRQAPGPWPHISSFEPVRGRCRWPRSCSMAVHLWHACGRHACGNRCRWCTADWRPGCCSRRIGRCSPAPFQIHR
jgi:hypothetical protein